MIKCELSTCANDAEVILRADDPKWHTRRSSVYLLCNHHYTHPGMNFTSWPIKVSDEDFLPTIAILAMMEL